MHLLHDIFIHIDLITSNIYISQKLDYFFSLLKNSVHTPYGGVATRCQTLKAVSFISLDDKRSARRRYSFELRKSKIMSAWSMLCISLPRKSM